MLGMSYEIQLKLHTTLTALNKVFGKMQNIIKCSLTKILYKIFIFYFMKKNNIYIHISVSVILLLILDCEKK